MYKNQSFFTEDRKNAKPVRTSAYTVNKIPNRPEGKNSWHCLFKIYSTTQNMGLVASDQWRLCHRATYFRSSGVCDSASVPLF